MKIKLTAHIHYTKYAWEEKGEFQIMFVRLNDEEHRTYVCEQEVEVEVPDDYDPRAQQISALEKQKKKAMADFQKTMSEINDRISRLQAIEFSGSDA